MRLDRVTTALTALAGAALVAWVFPQVQAAPVTEGREWRELHETTGLGWEQVASVCPQDGATPCEGSVGGKNLSGWVWATSDQVLELMERYAPGISQLDPPVVGGIEGFWAANGFLAEMRYTTYTSLTYSYSESTGGITSSLGPNGGPIVGSAGYSHHMTGTTATGSMGIGEGSAAAGYYTGVFLWRTPGGDYSPPVITPIVEGIAGNNGWYRSDVNVSWTVTDNESPIVATDGCDPSSISVDTAGDSLTCSATSAGFGGPASATVTVKRDVTSPAVDCGVAPTFELGQTSASVTASVIDDLSGPLAPSVSRTASTTKAGTFTVNLVGTDQAGNITPQQCSYNVTGVLCLGKTPTITGTAGNNVITGTSGNDVIHGLFGADTIDGKGGNDTICGGEGNDTLYGGEGDDDIDGGGGNDSIRGDSGADRCTSGEIRMSSCASTY